MRRSPALTICLVAGIAGVVLAVYLGYDLYQKRNATISSAEEETRRQVASAAREIDAELQRYAGLVDALAEDLSAGRVTESDRDARLTEIMSANPELYAVGIAYAPHAHDSRRRLFAPSSVRSGKALQLLGLEERLDYTGDDVEWFWAAMKNNTSWDEPVWNESEGKAIATYSAPLYPPDGVGREPLGVVFLSLTLDQVAKRVDALDIGKTGYGVVVSQKGYFLVHPSDADIRNRVSLFELQEMQSDASTRAALEAATHGKSGVFERENRMTGQDTWFFYEPIPTPRWSMFVTLIKDEIRFDQKYLRRSLIHTSVAAILGLVLLATWFLVRLYQSVPNRNLLWVLVAFSSLLLVAGMSIIRYVVYNQPSKDERVSVTIVDQAGLARFLKSQSGNASSGEPAGQIPTGIFLQSMKFLSVDELHVTGYIWQKYSDDKDQTLSRGFILPGAANPHISEAYRHKEGETETIGWYFEAVLRQDLDVSRYPFDHGDVSIRLLHKDLDRNIILVPDLAAYQLIHPTSRPGLEEQVTLSGWYVESSFFRYEFMDYGTDLGLGGRLREGPIPELAFNVRIKRYLLDVAIANGIPLFVVLIMLFAILTTSTNDEEQSKLLGFNPAGVMRLGAAFFFIVLLAHIQLRNTIQVQEVVLMEYFYFMVYVTILLVSLNNFLFSLEQYKNGRLGYNNGLVQKLLFWPLLLGVAFVITIVHFY